MPDEIPGEYLFFLKEAYYGVVATLMPSGNIQQTVLWLDYDGEHVLLNTAEQRQKTKNIARHPKLSILVMHPENAYHTLEIRGDVVDVVPDTDNAHIDSLAHKYFGAEKYFGGFVPAEAQAAQTRIIIKVKPTRVRTLNVESRRTWPLEQRTDRL